MLTSFLLCRFEISIKDLTITRVSRSKEEINKSNCVIKMLLGNQVLEFENVHLENCFNGVTLLDSMNTSESFVELNNPFTLLLEAEEVNHYAFFLSSPLFFLLFSFFFSFSLFQSMPPAALTVLIYKRNRVIGESWIPLHPIWRALKEKVSFSDVFSPSSPFLSCFC